MFWESVFGALGCLLKSSVLVGLLIYILATYIVALVTGVFGVMNEALGCLATTLLRPLLHGVLLSVFIVVLFPVMIGGTSITDLSLVWEFKWAIAKVGMLAVGIVIAIGFIPIVGAIIGGSAGAQILIQGIVIIHGVAGWELGAIAQQAGVTESIYPGLLECIGYWIISGAVLYLFGFLGVILTDQIESFEIRDSVKMAIVGAIMSIALVPGLLPVFMYAQHIGLAMRHAANH